MRFINMIDVNKRMRLINEIRAESDLANREYQMLRQGNYTKYLIIDIYEDQELMTYGR